MASTAATPKAVQHPYEATTDRDKRSGLGLIVKAPLMHRVVTGNTLTFEGRYQDQNHHQPHSLQRTRKGYRNS
ncbi:unnamed protein product [Victoria cruziana]